MNPFRKSSKQLSIFVTAGFPELQSLPEQISFLEANGVDFIEVGIPFSDPMADGPTIQKSSDVALKNGMNIEVLFQQMATMNPSIPLVMMSYFNPILHFGLERFLESAKDVGVQHVIIPDISLEIYESMYQSTFDEFGITLCFLVTPSTSTERIASMSAHSFNGFIYLISASMTTGNAVQQISSEEVSRIRMACGETPLMIGFGIKTREDVENVHQMADGAIIGSAYISALQEKREAQFISSILAHSPQSP